MRISIKTLTLALVAVLAAVVLVPAASADTCPVVTGFTCPTNPQGKPTGLPNNVQIIGTSTNGLLPITQVITTGSFGITMTGNLTAADIVVVAAFQGGSPSGMLNGTSFTTLSNNPFGPSQLGAISGTLSTLGFNSTPGSYGFVDLHTGLSSGGTITVNMTNVPAGTILYAIAIDANGNVIAVSPNSESGVTNGGGGTVPEPGTLSLLGTGLLGIAGLVRRRFLS